MNLRSISGTYRPLRWGGGRRNASLAAKVTPRSACSPESPPPLLRPRAKEVGGRGHLEEESFHLWAGEGRSGVGAAGPALGSADWAGSAASPGDAEG